MATTAAKRPRAKKAAAPAAVTEIIAYKGFDKNLQCRGYQYEIGKTFEHSGSVEACSAGFHSCENPLDVLDYYGIGDDNRFCRVRVGGTISRHDGDSKIASGSLTVEVELRLPAFIKAGVAYIMALAGPAKGGVMVEAASGNFSKLAASGDSSKLAASGNFSKLAAFDGNGKCIGIATGQAGNDDVPADVWLIARAGKLVAA